ncbi:energy transducer TonB [Hymenobacter daeguensis]
MSPADSPFAPLPAPGPHPATAELRAYAAGTLAPADEHRIEAHLLDCARCADLVEGFSMSDRATTDRAVAELRTRLQARIGQEEPTPVAGGWAWPRIAAAAALVAAVGGGLWTWQQADAPSVPVAARQEAVAPAAPHAAVPTPAAAPAPPAQAELAATPNATPAAKPAAKPSADYAAITLPRPPRQGLSRATPQARRDDDVAADYAVLSESEQKAASSPAPVVATETPAASAPAAGSVPDDGDMAAPAKKENSLAGRAATDSVPSLGEVAVARQAMKPKAKAMVADAFAPAIVRNTPMPVTPAINPAPVGGTPALRDYLRREASQFVPEINNLRISGTVRIRFMVEADGKLSHIKVVRGMRKDYDDEALRLLCEGPAWQPGIAGGKRAPLPMEVTVPF